MTMISYHASHEQFSPTNLLEYAILAEKYGFDACHSSDHFHPWSIRQGHSGYSFAWLGAAMQATKFPFSIITAPGQRQHPAIVAQAIATLLEMFPERLEIALGSGEALNEKITGTEWPEKPMRNERLKECYHIMTDLFKGEKVSHDGMVKILEAKLYDRPDKAPKLMCAAITKETAKWAGSWADGLLTVAQPHDKLYELIQGFKDNGGEGKPIHLQVSMSYAATQHEAIEGAYEQFRNNIIDAPLLGDVFRVSEFDELGEKTTRQDLMQKIRVSADLNYQIDLLYKDMELGIDNIILHNVNLGQQKFIEDFGEKVLPLIKESIVQSKI